MCLSGEVQSACASWQLEMAALVLVWFPSEMAKQTVDLITHRSLEGGRGRGGAGEREGGERGEEGGGGGWGLVCCVWCFM